MLLRVYNAQPVVRIVQVVVALLANLRIIDKALHAHNLAERDIMQYIFPIK